MLKPATLLGTTENEDLSIFVAAQRAGVSSATIRNWVKTGYLTISESGGICAESFRIFLEKIAGQEKLVSRANKSKKDSHDHDSVTSKYIHLLSSFKRNLDTLGIEYESSLSDSYKNKEGIYYTPQAVVEDLFTRPLEDISSKRFCDPCCGSGNFIMRAIGLGFKPENIYGYDTDSVAVALTRKRILEKTGYESDKIVESDFLEQSTQINNSFDYVFTNPPWGKKLSKQEREYYSSFFDAGKSNDTCSLFFFASLSCLKIGGKLGLLLPEAFFNISVFENARRKSLSLTVNRLIDYGKPFKGLVTKAQAIILTNKESQKISERISCMANGREFSRLTATFVNNPKSILNFHCDTVGAEVIDRAFSIRHITLKDRARWGLGIVTGNNKNFLIEDPFEGCVPIYKGSDIKRTGIKEPSNFIPSDMSLYQQVAPAKLYQAKGKIIYKFISSSLCFFYDTKQRLILNSANMLIIEDDFPISGSQLCCLLNSDFMNWLFKSVFGTHKILRGDLESLPIHVDYFVNFPKFSEDTYLDFIDIKKTENGTYHIKS